jgi:hypothetical protein
MNAELENEMRQDKSYTFITERSVSIAGVRVVS